MNATLKIEHSGNSVYAVETPDGPAVYPTLDLLIEAVRADAVEVHDGDREYYAEQAERSPWLPVPAEDLADSR
jgi:hypothetical protein